MLPICGFAAPTGMKFKAWSVGGTEYQPGASIAIAADTTITAVWKEYFCTVSFVANGATGSMESNSIRSGEASTLPEHSFTAPNGKRFKAWQIGGKSYAPGIVITVSDDMTVMAVWEDGREPTAQTRVNVAALAAYIKANGTTDLNGNKKVSQNVTVTNGTNTTTITYLENESCLQLNSFIRESSGTITTSVFFTFDIRTYSAASRLTYREDIEMSGSTGWFTYTAFLNVPTYKESDVFSFNFGNSGGSLGGFSQEFTNEDGNRAAKAAFLSWDVLNAQTLTPLTNELRGSTAQSP